MDNLPEELKLHPVPLVGVFGLDTTVVSNKILWELLNNSERKTINYANLDENGQKISQGKPERTSYEWYIPKGILKAKWLEKHLQILPAVAVCFADLDWNDPLWPEKKAQVVEKLQQLKTIIGSRRCKIALVLIQKGPPLPPGEDPIAGERAAALCQACDLPAKYLFALPCHADHLHGYTMRLESAFLDIAQAHYLSEARRVKSHREHLNRTNHAYLFVRHAFKIAMYCDLRQDQGNALKHYLQAYENLLQVRIVDNNLNEVKAVATIIAYKIWKLNFLQNQPREAINNFKSHVDQFKRQTGPQELEFEHEAWLANQYETFGSLFEEAVASGLPAIQREHPGFYFQQAAAHAQERKKFFKESLISGIPPADMTLLDAPLEFYGQRPWRPGKVSIEPPSPEIESEGVAYLKFLESKFDHSKQIISLLNRAVKHFESQKSPGHKRHLLSLVAKEHCEAGNYRDAIRIFHPLFWEFRCDDWWSLLTSLLQDGLRAAYLAGLRGDYFTIGAELCCDYSLLEIEQKKRIYENLMGILEGIAPKPEEDLEEMPSTVWEANSCVATIALNTVASLIDMKATFQKPVYSCDSEVVLEVFIKNLTPFPITISRVAVTLSNAKYSDLCQMSEKQILMPKTKETRLEFRLYADPMDVGTGFSISSVSAFIGNLSGRYVLFHSEGSQSDELNPWKAGLEFSASRRPWNTLFSTEGIPQPGVEIRPKRANINLEFAQYSPALAKEWYPLSVTLTNQESTLIDAIDIVITAQFEKPPQEQDLRVFIAGSPTDDASVSKELVLHLSDVESGSTHSVEFHVKSPISSQVVVNVKAVYSVKVEKDGRTLNCPSVGSASTSVKVVEPFKVATELKTIRFLPVHKVFSHEEILVLAHLKTNSPHPLRIEDCQFRSSDLELLSNLQSLSGLEIKSEECASECWVLKVKPKHHSSAVSEMSVTWKRANSDQPPITTIVPLQSLLIEESSLAVEMKLPAQGFIREPICAKIAVKNLSSSFSQCLQVTMDSNDAFMFSGNKMVVLTIDPLTSCTLTYNLYPLLAGYVALPAFRLSPAPGELPEDKFISWSQEGLNEILERSIPSHIYVLPQTKRGSQPVA